MSGFPEYFFRSERFALPLLAEVVDTQRGWQTAALFIADGRGRQHDGGNDEGEGLTDLSGNGGQIEAVFLQREREYLAVKILKKMRLWLSWMVVVKK